MRDREHQHRDAVAIEELLRELDELRELDRRRNAHAPGSLAHEAATVEVDLRTKRLMDRFRDLKERHSKARGPRGDWTRPIDARHDLSRNGGSLLN